MKEYYLKLPKEKADKEKQTGLSELERSCGKVAARVVLLTANFDLGVNIFCVLWFVLIGLNIVVGCVAGIISALSLIVGLWIHGNKGADIGMSLFLSYFMCFIVGGTCMLTSIRFN
jgi:hypothetical protein